MTHTQQFSHKQQHSRKTIQTYNICTISTRHSWGEYEEERCDGKGKVVR